MTETLRLEWVDPSELQENPANWRAHPPKQIAALRDAIKEVGWAGALLYNEQTQRLIDGHARRKLFHGSKVPVLIGSWDEATEKKILASLDPLSALAEADKPKLDALLREVNTGSEALQEMFSDLATKSGLYQTNGEEAVSSDNTIEEDEGKEDEDSLDILFKAPFPYFGGKSRIAKMVWKRFGDVKNYIEPFFGSGAVLLNRPQPFDGTETVNDKDGLICNFWRALQADPDTVAKYADWPVNENDLHARHAWLVGQKDSLQTRLEGDPEYFDTKIAGWWVWGMACWIGGEFCSGKGPWGIEDGQLVHLGDAGQGVKRQRVHLGDAGQGVERRRRVHLYGGRGVQGKYSTGWLSGDNAGTGEQGLLAWMQALAQRIRRVRVCCGDWTRICGGRSGDALGLFFSSGNTCGIFLDPPYADTAGRDPSIYRVEDLSVAHDVMEWAIRHSNDERLRIALCGYEGEHDMPKDWQCVQWKAAGGMANQGNNHGKENRFRERVWFSKFCLRP